MQYWGLTDPGMVRKQNQDAYHIVKLDKTSVLAIVCDGMGGAKSGNVASSLAVDVFVQEVQRRWVPGTDWDKADQILRSAAKQFVEFDGMGTTLVAALIRGQKVTVVNVGDSRAYGITESGIRQLTKDHSLVQLMVDRGEIRPEMAKSYPGKNLITRAIGTEPVVLCDMFRQEFQRGDFLLLCSDGLSNMMDDQEILFEVVHGVNKSRCCQRLLNITKTRGAPDNVTSILIAL